MILKDLLSHIHENNVQLWVDGDRLRFKGAESVMTPEILSELRQHKAELISILRQVDENTRSHTSGIRPASREEGHHQVSFAQRPFWLLEQMQSGNFSNHLALCSRLTGALSSIALKQSIEEIIRRHEILRTTFSSMDGKPVQIILPSLELNMKEVDLRDLSAPGKEEDVYRLAKEEYQKPFNLTEGPLLRAVLFQLEDQEYIFLLVMHHIISDGASFGLFYRELGTLYEAFSRGNSSPLADLPVQYVDYAHTYRESLQAENMAAQLDYWKQRLSGDLPVLEIPTDRSRPAAQTYVGARQYLSIEADQYQALKSLSQREGCSLYMSLVALLQTLLYRYSGQEDILIGFPMSNRKWPETQELIGMFINMLVLRTDLGRNPSFLELMGRVRETTLGAYSNQDVPFDSLVEELQPDRDASRNPFFQIILQLSASEQLLIPDINVTPVPFDGGSTQLDIAMHLYEGPSGITGYIEYNTDLFDAATMVRMAEHFKNITSAVLVDPEQCISALPLLTSTEKEIYHRQNENQIEYSAEVCLHKLFEEQAALRPNHIAVVCGEQRLTYRALNSRANLLAYELMEKGVGPEVPVGLCMERSTDLMVGLLGILKAGGAYVPLDPTYPEDRLGFMLEDTQAPVIVTRQNLVDSLPDHRAQVLCMDLLDLQSEGHAPQIYENPDNDVSPDNLAYIIYTSGSTGRPKGVCIPHCNVKRLFDATASWFDFRPEDVWTVFHSFSFDFSVWELWGPILHGGCMVIVPFEESRSPVLFYKLLVQERVTVINQTPSALRQLIQVMPSLGRDNDLSLRYIFTGGEALPRDLGNDLLDRGAEVWNLYGPTEVTVWASMWAVERGEGPVSLGWSIANTRLHVLDQNLQPVPIGVPGELHIGGDRLARGYLNRPELNAERFIPDPFTDDEDARLYKTGDLCRFLSDGSIEYIGRNDFQVKIRGFRIEIGEIESVLSEHPRVREAVVLAREDVPGDQRLVAYIVPDGKAPETEDLRQVLKVKLAEYMVPSAFVMLEKMPLNANRKVDRKALPAPDRADLGIDQEIVDARDALEAQIKNIWEQTLETDSISIRDNFFDIGGHSLLAVTLFERIEQATGKNLPLATLFQAPTIEQLAEVLREDEEDVVTTSASPLVKIQPYGSKTPFFCVHGHFGNVLNFANLARELGHDQPFYGLQAIGLNGNEPPLPRIEGIAERYIEEIRSVQPEGPYTIGGFCYGTLVAVEIAHQLRAQGQDVGHLVMIDPHPSLYPTLISPAIVKKFWKHVSRQRIERHAHEISERNLVGRVAYLVEGVVRKIKTITQDGILNLIDQICEKFGKPLPKIFQDVSLTNALAFNAYVHRVYEGDADLFLSKAVTAHYTNDPESDWSGIAKGFVRVHLVDDDGLIAGGEMFNEPYVQGLGKELSRCLEKFQTDDNLDNVTDEDQSVSTVSSEV